MSRQTTIWTLAALLGIVLTAGITWATSQLTSQRIGISSEPISAASGLAPRAVERRTQRRTVTHKAKAHKTTTAPLATPAPSTETAPTVQAPPSTQTESPGAVEAQPEAAPEPTQKSGAAKSSADDGSGNGEHAGGAGSGHGRDD
jgi:cell envelope opacity-associated protein A